MDEIKVLNRLNEIYPDKIIYADDYTEKTKNGLSREIHHLFKKEQKSRVQWLESKGFQWKETGYIEPDMRSEARGKQVNSAFELADYVFKKYPLIGEYIPSEEERKALYSESCETVKKIVNDIVNDKKIVNKSDVTDQEKTVLILETVQLLKKWSKDKGGENGGTFWKYIFRQYGINMGADAPPDDSTVVNSHLYSRLRNHFCGAANYIFKKYNRFFAPADTHQYYNTLLLHAIAPEKSIMALFDILFDFYTKNLDYQYIEEDTSYKQFVKGMCARWNRESGKSVPDVHLRSLTVASGLQVLFQNRPGYMASICDMSVKKMDALLRQEMDDQWNPVQNYWDYLLDKWYSEKRTIEHHVRGEKRSRRTEYVATTSERIFTKFYLDKSKGTIGILIPKIRLPGIADARPVVQVFQNNDCLYEKDMSVTGDELCYTTQKLFIPLQETKYDFSQDPMLRLKISFNGETLYQSGQKLSLHYVLLDKTGSDKASRSGTGYLFTAANRSVEFTDESSVRQLCHPGQLFQIDFDNVGTVSIDGQELFTDNESADKFRHHVSTPKLSSLKVWEQEAPADVFSEKFSLFIHLPAGDNPIRYQISLDSGSYEKLLCDDGKITVESINDDGKIHSIKIKDITNDTLKFEYRYTVLSECSVTLDKNMYRAGLDTVSVQFCWHELTSQFVLPLLQDTNFVRFTAPGLELDFELEVPTVSCIFQGENAFLAPKTVWHKDISDTEFVKLDLPTGWTGNLMLGCREVPRTPNGNEFELGNTLRASGGNQETKDDEVLWLSLREEVGNTLHYEICEIVFTPRFKQAPLEVMENKLWWRSRGNFCGDSVSKFHIECTTPDGSLISYEATTEDIVIAEIGEYAKGEYSYEVTLIKRSAFTKQTSFSIYEGKFTIGDPCEFYLDGKEIEVTQATYWSLGENSLKETSMRQGSGILCDFAWEGYSIPSGEDAELPHYRATLFFVKNDGIRTAFNSRESTKYELVNPVHVWIVNEYLLILRCAEEDSVQIDMRYKTIVNQEPRFTMTRDEQEKWLEIPDYFKYTMREAY